MNSEQGTLATHRRLGGLGEGAKLGSGQPGDLVHPLRAAAPPRRQAGFRHHRHGRRRPLHPARHDRAARPTAQGRTPLLLTEGIHWVVQQPAVWSATIAS
nr:hypothetical protein [Streptomyces luteolifulvus]